MTVRLDLSLVPSLSLFIHLTHPSVPHSLHAFQARKKALRAPSFTRQARRLSRQFSPRLRPNEREQAMLPQDAARTKGKLGWSRRRLLTRCASRPNPFARARSARPDFGRSRRRLPAAGTRNRRTEAREKLSSQPTIRRESTPTSGLSYWRAAFRG